MSDEALPASDESDTRPEDERAPNAATPAGVRKQRERARRKADKAGDFWRDTLVREGGRDEVGALIFDLCGALRDPVAFAPAGAPDANATWFNLGKKAVGMNLLLKLLMMDPDSVRAMLAERSAEYQAMVTSAEAARRG